MTFGTALVGAYLAGRQLVGLRAMTLDLGGSKVKLRALTRDEYVVARTANGERSAIDRVLDDLDATSIFYDVGANIGLYAIPASRRCSRVIAFEPSPANVEALQHNLALNRCANVEVQGVALGDRSGKLPFFVSAGGAGTQVNTLDKSVATRFGTDPHKIEVDVRRLDELVQAGLPPPTVVKIDVEGAEGPVLRGARECLAKHQPTLHVEIHPNAIGAFGDDVAGIRQFLTDLDYAIEDFPGELTSRIVARASRGT